MSEKFQFEINIEEAIVLFDYLTRVTEKDILDATLDSPAEQIALWNLQAILEKELIEPFGKDYRNVVKEARKALLHDSSTKAQSPRKEDK